MTTQALNAIVIGHRDVRGARAEADDALVRRQHEHAIERATPVDDVMTRLGTVRANAAMILDSGMMT